MFSLRYCLQNFSLDQYSFFEGKLINLSKEGDNFYKVECFEDEKIIWKLSINAKINSILNHNGILILEDYKTKLIFIDLLKGNIINEIFGCYYIIRVIDNCYLLLEPFKNINTPSLYSKTFAKIWQLELPVAFWLSKELPELIGFRKMIDNYTIDFRHFSRFDQYSGNEMWSFELTDFPCYYDPFNKELNTEVNKFIGIANNVLWVGLTNGTILLLEFETGKKIAIIQHPSYRFGKNFNIFPETGAMYVDRESGLVIGCNMYHYWEVSLTTYEVNHWDLTEHFEKENIYCSAGKSGEFVFDSDFVYFMGKDQCKVAALSRKNKNIVWEHKLVSDSDNRVMPRIMPMKIQLHNKRLFVQDSVKRLYVFDRI